MTVKKTPDTKDDMLHVITAQLLEGLTMLKEQLGEKKYEKRIKKAAKLLVEGIKKTSPKKPDAAGTKAIVKKEKNSKAKLPTIPAKAKVKSKIPKVKKAETIIRVKAK